MRWPKLRQPSVLELASALFVAGWLGIVAALAAWTSPWTWALGLGVGALLVSGILWRGILRAEASSARKPK